MDKIHDAHNPCRGCRRRTMICHISCQEYTAWQENHAQYIAAQRVQTGIDYAISQQRKRIVWRRKRKDRKQ